jgi:23S rRNA (cytidine1920-2'-O)/16S rRNA (cytidine1409-2'-O)-methyltransferase
VTKQRADLALHARGLAESREQAQRLISAGRVRTGTLVLVKASQMVADDAELVVSEPERYVSRGGTKLEAALREFAIDPTGLACMDLGASTGGFTDCLLQHGAASVLAVDVGRAQLHQRLREDPRVTLLEGTNARDLPKLSIHDSRFTIHDANSTADGQRLTANGPDFFVADLSFISLRKVLPSVASRLAPGTPGVVLLKPQFEAGPKEVPRGGVIRDAAVLERVRSGFVAWLEGEGWQVFGVIPSPIRGGDGNTEFLVHLGTPRG